MLKESAIATVSIISIVVGICLVFGVEGAQIPRWAVLFGAIPFLVATRQQIRLLSDIRWAKAQRWLVNLPPSVRRVELRPPTAKLERAEPLQLPEPNRIRLVSVKAPSTKIAASDLHGRDGETLRFVPVLVPDLLDDVPVPDLVDFIDQLRFRGLSVRAWVGVRMPSGRTVDVEYHDLLIRPLVKCGAVIGRRPRVAGKLVMEAAEIKQRLGLTAGPQIEALQGSTTP